ncbi:MAG: hypothetical protein V4717_13300 [Bacteroidota bacterium]
MNLLSKLAITIVGTCLFQACSDKKIELAIPPLSDYMPLNVGKYITYRLDSTNITKFGADTAVTSYRVRELVDAEITDGLGRKAYRILRTITDSGGAAPFSNNNTFMISPQSTDWIERVENNLRFMSLRSPVMENFEWKGNSFIDALSINSPVRYLYDWNYKYQDIGKPFTVRGKTYDNTITVLQRNEEFPEGPFNPSQPFKQWDYSIEVYAKGVGLIYKNFDHKVWQGPAPGSGGGYWEDGSYRVIMEAIDHN